MTSQLPRFRCLFLSCQQQKNTKNGAAVTSLRSFLFRDDFKVITSHAFVSFDLFKGWKRFKIAFQRIQSKVADCKEKFCIL